MPDTNRYARKTYSPDGVNREYSIDIPFLDVDHLTLEHNGTDLEYGDDWTLANPTTIRTVNILTAGSGTLQLTRNTPVLNPVAVFTSPGTFTFANLNRIIKQLLYGVQESFDRSVEAETILEDAEAAASAAAASASTASTAQSAASGSATSAAAAELAAEAAQAAAELAAGSMNPASNISYTGNNTHAGTETFNSTGTFNALFALGAAATFSIAAAALVRLRAALGVDSRTTVSDADYPALSTDRLISYTSLSANRTVTLPAANALTAGQRIVILDESGSASQSIAISVAPNGSDTIAGANTTQVAINIGRGKIELVSNGSNGWNVVGEWSVRYVATLGADVALNNTGSYFDTVSVAQGTVGRWRCRFKGTVTSGGIANVNARLWDGATVIDSGRETVAGANQAHMIPLLGEIAAPAGNIKVSLNDASRTDGTAKFNFSGNSKDTTLVVRRIG